MKKGVFIVCASVTTVAVFALAFSSGLSHSVDAFAQYSPATAGTWVHYDMSLPGTATGAPQAYGVREYWVECGGGYQFSKPSVADSLIKDGGTDYDFSGFPTNGWDPRMIIPINETKGTFNSVLYDVTTESNFVGEISLMKGFQYTAASELPGVKETKKVLWLDNNGNRPSFYADTIGATRVFDSYANFINVFKSANGTAYAADEYLDGYYLLASDLTINKNVNYPDTSLNYTEATDRGFSGTLDGRGHSFNGNGLSYYNGGMFGFLTGGEIRNVTFDKIKLAGNGYAAIAGQAHESIISNVTFNFDQITATSKKYGSIILRYSQRNLFENITINATAGVNSPCLFGTVGSNLTNIYDNIVYKGDSAAPVAAKDDSNEISVPQKGFQFVPNSSTLISRERQDIFVNSSNTIKLDVGSTEVGTVSSIDVKVGAATYSLGNDLNNLVIPNELKEKPEDHGQGLVTITNSNSETFTLPVTLVTDYISQNSDLAKIRGTNLEAEVYGYFALTNNIIVDYTTTSGIGQTAAGALSTTGNGFYGEFDGRGYELAGNISNAKYGIISGAKKGAVIKNLRTRNTGYTGWGCSSLIGQSFGFSSLYQPKIYNIDVEATVASTDTNRKGILCNACIDTAQFMNITVNTPAREGVNVSTFNFSLFVVPSWYNNPTFNASIRFNHITWNTATGAATTRVIDTVETIPYGVTINYL